MFVNIRLHTVLSHYFQFFLHTKLIVVRRSIFILQIGTFILKYELIRQWQNFNFMEVNKWSSENASDVSFVSVTGSAITNSKDPLLTARVRLYHSQDSLLNYKLTLSKIFNKLKINSSLISISKTRDSVILIFLHWNVDAMKKVTIRKKTKILFHASKWTTKGSKNSGDKKNAAGTTDFATGSATAKLNGLRADAKGSSDICILSERDRIIPNWRLNIPHWSVDADALAHQWLTITDNSPAQRH